MFHSDSAWFCSWNSPPRAARLLPGDAACIAVWRGPAWTSPGQRTETNETNVTRPWRSLMFGCSEIGSFRIHLEYSEDPQRGDVLKRKPRLVYLIYLIQGTSHGKPRDMHWDSMAEYSVSAWRNSCHNLDSPSGGNMEKQHKNHWNPANLEFYQLGAACSRKPMKKRVCRLCSIIPIAASWCLLSWRC